MTEQIEFKKINHDVNGNPRYVCHFLHLNTPYEKSDEFWAIHGIGTVSEQYRRAVKRANKIGGRKYHNKSYGGGIVFQSYNIRETENDIKRVVEEAQSHE